MRKRALGGFAVPFVLVVAGGCGSTSKKPLHPNPPGPERTALPDSPFTGTGTKSPGPDGSTIITYEGGNKLVVNADGTCVAEYNANCGNANEDAPSTCNPPAPREVTCPADAK